MKRHMIVAVILGMFAVTSAQAAGCLKGAAVGGVAGHFAGKHAVLGAVGGCIIGHHLAKKQKEKEQTQAKLAH